MCRSQPVSWQRVVECLVERGGYGSGSGSRVEVALVRIEAVEGLAFVLVDLGPESEPVVEHPTP